MEGLWETGPQAPLHPFGWVDTAGGRTMGPKIPAGLSLLVEGKADHVVTGLNDIPPDLRQSCVRGQRQAFTSRPSGRPLRSAVAHSVAGRIQTAGS